MLDIVAREIRWLICPQTQDFGQAAEGFSSFRGLASQFLARRSSGQYPKRFIGGAISKRGPVDYAPDKASDERRSVGKDPFLAREYDPVVSMTALISASPQLF